MSELPEAEPKPLSPRDRLRALALGAPAVDSGKLVEFHGERFEIRRLTLAQQERIGKLKGASDIKTLVHTVIESVYVPGTKEKVFTAADEAVMMTWDAGPGTLLAEFMKAAKRLAAEAEEVEKNSEAAPTDSSS